ncbi:hypothetical protein RhiJN_08908 [Ceratobasidium sp. AG-Ba]|nr:hypothetical protein RhiJN_08908 [Ceratobasidium sp. AG-Ba]
MWRTTAVDCLPPDDVIDGATELQTSAAESDIYRGETAHIDYKGREIYSPTPFTFEPICQTCKYISFYAPVAGYLIKPGALVDGPPAILFKKQQPAADLVEASVRGNLCVKLNCDMPLVDYKKETRFILVPSGANHKTGKETLKDQDCKKAAETLGLKGLEWVYLPNTFVH